MLSDLMGNYINFQDMFDGGGPGQFGDTFQGGALSDVLNQIGIRPYGYAARQDNPMASAPPPRPVTMSMNAPAQPQPQPMDWRSTLAEKGMEPVSGDPVQEGTYRALNSPRGLLDAAERAKQGDARSRALLATYLAMPFGGM